LPAVLIVEDTLLLDDNISKLPVSASSTWSCYVWRWVFLA